MSNENISTKNFTAIRSPISLVSVVDDDGGGGGKNYSLLSSSSSSSSTPSIVPPFASLIESTTTMINESISTLTRNVAAGLPFDASTTTTTKASSSIINETFPGANVLFNRTSAHVYTFACKDGLFLPCWYSDGQLWTQMSHGFIYLIALLYLFVGVAIIADRFMESIENITSQERLVIVKHKNKNYSVVSMRIWNETVSNLTLMALGSSAPEIMLSVIEIYAQNFQAGELGPGTIVGSAAFNMFIIIAVCVWAVPTGTIKKIKYLRVFIVTLTFSVFAYIWMLVILVWNTPGVIEVWEGLMTLAFFIITVSWAYVADRRLLLYKYLDRHYRLKDQTFRTIANGDGGGGSGDGNGDGDGDEKPDDLNDKMEMTPMMNGGGGGGSGSNEKLEITSTRVVNNNTNAPPVNALESNGNNGAFDASIMMNRNLKFMDASEEDLTFLQDQRENIIEILKEVKTRFPNATSEEIETLARMEIAKLEPKSRAYYRILASKRYLGASTSSDVLQHQTQMYTSTDNVNKATISDVEEPLSTTVDIHFDPQEYTVMENVGDVLLTVTRVGDIASTIIVSYTTEDGTAKAKTDYVAKSDVIIFGPGEAHKQISITIINDEEFEQDEYFFVHLYDAQYQTAVVDSVERPVIRLINERAKVTILDDDHSGIFGFVNNVFQIPENIGEYKLSVIRSCGARGKVAVPYHTEPGTAKEGEDFQGIQGELVFDNNETQKDIALQIINNIAYEKNSIFYVELDKPHRVHTKASLSSTKATSAVAGSDHLYNTTTIDGEPKLGEMTRCMIRIRESKDFKVLVDRLMSRRNKLSEQRANSWETQLIDAVRMHKQTSSTSSLSFVDDVESASPVVRRQYQQQHASSPGKVSHGAADGSPPSGGRGGGGDDGDDDARDGVGNIMPDGIVMSDAEFARKVAPTLSAATPEERATFFDYFKHFSTLPWKLMFAIVPPADLYNGWPCFVVSIIIIGILTTFINDIASHFGSTVHLKDSITAISLVALGTSLPDTFASMIAATNEKHADASIGNVTGSNAVNVFLGIGIAWTVAAIYHAVNGTPGGFQVEPGNLAYSVMLFCICAFFCASTMMIRRWRLGGELGGPLGWKVCTVMFFTFLWLFYLVMSVLDAYNVIKGF